MERQRFNIFSANQRAYFSALGLVAAKLHKPSKAQSADSQVRDTPGRNSLLARLHNASNWLLSSSRAMQWAASQMRLYKAVKIGSIRRVPAFSRRWMILCALRCLGRGRKKTTSEVRRKKDL
jgi:hypothetical protein